MESKPRPGGTPAWSSGRDWRGWIPGLPCYSTRSRWAQGSGPELPEGLKQSTGSGISAEDLPSALGRLKGKELASPVSRGKVRGQKKPLPAAMPRFLRKEPAGVFCILGGSKLLLADRKGAEEGGRLKAASALKLGCESSRGWVTPAGRRDGVLTRTVRHSPPRQGAPLSIICY